jgi:hypothetical protein
MLLIMAQSGWRPHAFARSIFQICTLKPRRPCRRRLNHEAGIKPETVQATQVHTCASASSHRVSRISL